MNLIASVPGQDSQIDYMLWMTVLFALGLPVAFAIGAWNMWKERHKPKPRYKNYWCATCQAGWCVEHQGPAPVPYASQRAVDWSPPDGRTRRG